MKIGDRVTYDDEARLEDLEMTGTVVGPTPEELAEAKSYESVGPQYGDVRVAWDDGERHWEHPSYLVVVQEAGS